MSGFLESSFGWVWETTLYGSALVLIVIIACTLFGKRLSPSWQCALGLIAVTRFLLPFSPESPLSLYNWIPGFQEERANAELASAIVTPDASRKIAALSESETLSFALPVPPNFSPENPASTESGSVDSKGTLPTYPSPILNSETDTGYFSLPVAHHTSIPSFNLTRFFATLWFLGFVSCGSFAIYTALTFRKRLSAKSQKAPAALDRVLEECAMSMGIRKRVGLLVVERISSPVLVGAWKPTIVIPAEIDPSAARHVILHELAHLRRGDLLWNWVLAAARTIHWFNPIAWLATSKVIADRELACDATVLRPLSRGQRISYGRTLLNFSQPLMERLPLSGAVPFTKPKSEIQRRIHMIAQYKTTGRFRHLFAGTLAAAIALTTFTSANSADEREGERANPERKEGAREGGEREGVRRDGDREGGEREGVRRDGDREGGEREGVRRDGDREGGEREGVRRDGDREGGEREGVRRDGDREGGEREGVRRDGDREGGDREGGERDRPVGPDAQRQARHLMAAAENLAAAGMGEQANALRQRAEMLMRGHAAPVREGEGGRERPNPEREGGPQALERRVEELSRAVRELHEMMAVMRRELAERPGRP